MFSFTAHRGHPDFAAEPEGEDRPSEGFTAESGVNTSDVSTPQSPHFLEWEESDLILRQEGVWAPFHTAAVILSSVLSVCRGFEGESAGEALAGVGVPLRGQELPLSASCVRSLPCSAAAWGRPAAAPTADRALAPPLTLQSV